MQHLTLEQFRAANDAGGVMSVMLKAEGVGFEMQIETQRGLAINKLKISFFTL